MTKETGKNYERQVMRYLTEQDRRTFFELDIKIPDTTGSRNRQIDVWLRNTREIVECKHQAAPIGVGVIDALFGAMDDVGATGGRVYSHSGFSAGACARASKVGIECIEFPFEKNVDVYPEPEGGGYYAGRYMDLCHAATVDCDTFGSVQYGDDQGHETPICVGNSVDWHNRQMHSFIAYVILSHQLGRIPEEWAISGFIDEYGERLESGQEWSIEENEAQHFAIAVR
ncbi:restriction endonuclease [Streptomyces sp. NPDC029003]|uniref:restriction endonuclease n=1 Tax=Streptomyces sp. NPDC029003 TaxID=3155125 RepID=UPI00340F8793